MGEGWLLLFLNSVLLVRVERARVVDGMHEGEWVLALRGHHRTAWHGKGLHQQWALTIVYSLIIQEQILKFVCSFLFYLSSSSLNPRSSFDGHISLNMNCSAV